MRAGQIKCRNWL